MLHNPRQVMSSVFRLWPLKLKHSTAITQNAHMLFGIELDEQWVLHRLPKWSASNWKINLSLGLFKWLRLAYTRYAIKLFGYKKASGASSAPKWTI